MSLPLGLLLELEDLLVGTSVHSWGYSMEDIITLPDMKTLTCVDGIVWPPKVRAGVSRCHHPYCRCHFC